MILNLLRNCCRTNGAKKKILGRLIDSAQTNIRRFIVARYEEKPFIKYAQDEWVAAANYQQYDTGDLIQLWVLLNRHAEPVGTERQRATIREGHTYSVPRCDPKDCPAQAGNWQGFTLTSGVP